jgi:hypothetical protein
VGIYKFGDEIYTPAQHAGISFNLIQIERLHWHRESQELYEETYADDMTKLESVPNLAQFSQK